MEPDVQVFSGSTFLFAKSQRFLRQSTHFLLGLAALALLANSH